MFLCHIVIEECCSILGVCGPHIPKRTSKMAWQRAHTHKFMTDLVMDVRSKKTMKWFHRNQPHTQLVKTMLTDLELIDLDCVQWLTSSAGNQTLKAPFSNSCKPMSLLYSLEPQVRASAKPRHCSSEISAIPLVTLCLMTLWPMAHAPCLMATWLLIMRAGEDTQDSKEKCEKTPLKPHPLVRVSNFKGGGGNGRGWGGDSTPLWEAQCLSAMALWHPDRHARTTSPSLLRSGKKQEHKD